MIPLTRPGAPQPRVGDVDGWQRRDHLRRLGYRRQRQGPLVHRPRTRRRHPPLRHRPRPSRREKSSVHERPRKPTSGASVPSSPTPGLLRRPTGAALPRCRTRHRPDIDPRYRRLPNVGVRQPGLYRPRQRHPRTPPSVAASPADDNFARLVGWRPRREILNSTRISKWDWLRPAPKSASSPRLRRPPTTPRSPPPPSRRHPRRLARGSHLAHHRRKRASAIYSTTIPTEHRLYTLMDDPITGEPSPSRTSAYNQPPNPASPSRLRHGPAPAG